ncbi:MAG: hypothetical protein AAF636_22625, partial [Pseudomonadota bacterium]
ATERRERKKYCGVRWLGIGFATGAGMNCRYGAGRMRSIAVRGAGRRQLVREGTPKAEIFELVSGWTEKDSFL